MTQRSSVVIPTTLGAAAVLAAALGRGWSAVLLVVLALLWPAYVARTFWRKHDLFISAAWLLVFRLSRGLRKIKPLTVKATDGKRRAPRARSVYHIDGGVEVEVLLPIGLSLAAFDRQRPALKAATHAVVEEIDDRSQGHIVIYRLYYCDPLSGSRRAEF